MQPKVPERLVGLLPDGIAQHFRAGEILRFLDLTVGEKLANLRHGVGRAGADVVVRFAGPEGVLVKLDALIRRAAENHRPEPAVADGIRLQPLRRRFDRPDRRRHVASARSAAASAVMSCSSPGIDAIRRRV